MRRKDPRYDLRLKYKKTLELALIISLLLVAGVFLASKEFNYVPTVKHVEQVVIKVEDIPVVRDYTPPPQPARPVIPVEDPEVPIGQDIVIPIDVPYVYDKLLPPPFHRVEEKPVLIGGFQAIMDYIRKNDLYPELARTAESNGEVVLLFTISETGEVTNLTIAAEHPAKLGFGEAAMQAMAAMRFTPGKQRDKPVRVRMQQTIRFRIK